MVVKCLKGMRGIGMKIHKSETIKKFKGRIPIRTLSKSRKASLAKLFSVDFFTANPRFHKNYLIIYTFMKALSPTAQML